MATADPPEDSRPAKRQRVEFFDAEQHAHVADITSGLEPALQESPLSPRLIARERPPGASSAWDAVDDHATDQAEVNGVWRQSIYVDAFFLVLNTVLDEESHLFDAAERAVFDALRDAPYDAQYLCVAMSPKARNTAAANALAT